MRPGMTIMDIEGVTAYIGIVRSRERLKYAWDSENNIKKQTNMEDSYHRGIEV